jgi:cyanate lyase
MNGQLLAEKIMALKHAKRISWKELAEAIGRSPGFATAALLGQMLLSKDEAQKIGHLLGLNEDEVALLQQAPYRGSLPTAIPTDRLSRSVPGTTTPLMPVYWGRACLHG